MSPRGARTVATINGEEAVSLYPGGTASTNDADFAIASDATSPPPVHESSEARERRAVELARRSRSRVYDEDDQPRYHPRVTGRTSTAVVATTSTQP